MDAVALRNWQDISKHAALIIPHGKRGHAQQNMAVNYKINTKAESSLINKQILTGQMQGEL